MSEDYPGQAYVHKHNANIRRAEEKAMSEQRAGRGEGLAGLVAQFISDWRMIARNFEGNACAAIYTMHADMLEQRILPLLEAAAPPSTAQCEGCDAVDGRKTVSMCADCIRKVSLEARRLERGKAGEAVEVERIAQEMCHLAGEMHQTASGYAYEKLGKYGEQILRALATPSPQAPAPEVEAINDRAKVERALNALDHLCDMWAEEVDLERIVKAISGNPDKVRALLRQSWIEGAYRGRTSHVDYPQTVSSAATQEEPCGTAENVAISTNADTLPIARTAENSVGLLLPDAEWNSLSSESKDKLKKWFEIATEHLEQMLRPAATQEPAGSGARHKRDLSGHDLCPICGHSHSEWGAAVAAMHESPSTFGSPRKVGEDGAQTFEQWWQAEGVHMVRTTHRTGYELMREAWNAALRPSSAPVGSSKRRSYD